MNFDEQIREYCNRDDMDKEHGKDDRVEAAGAAYAEQRSMNALVLRMFVYRARKQTDLDNDACDEAEDALNFFNI